MMRIQARKDLGSGGSILGRGNSKCHSSRAGLSLESESQKIKGESVQNMKSKAGKACV